MRSRRSRLRRRRNLLPFVVVAGLIAVPCLLALGVYLGTRPASIAITVQPADALISFAGMPAGTGSLVAKNLQPGSYVIGATRPGFKPLQVSVRLARGTRLRRAFSLEALPHRLTLGTVPGDVAYSLQLPSGATTSGTTPIVGRFPAGTITVSLSRPGYNPLVRRLFLEKDSRLTWWLDKEGQLLGCLTVFTCGPAPQGVAFTPDSKEVWVTILDRRPSVEIYDPATGERKGGITLGKHGAIELAFSADGVRAYASQMQTARVYEIDVASHKVLRTFDSESSWSKTVALAPDDKTLYVSNWVGNDVSEIDLATGVLRRRIPVMKTPRGLYPTPDGKYLWVAGFAQGDLERVELGSGARKRVFAGGGALRHIVGDPRTGLLYTSDMAKDVIWATDMKTGKTRKLADTDEKPNTIDLSPDGKVLYVSCRGENNPASYYLPGPEWGSVLAIDTATGRSLDAVVGGNQTTALDVSPNGKLLVFSDFLDNRLRTFAIPDYPVLEAGLGGRTREHVAEIAK